MNGRLTVAIVGPDGAGKSTIARRVTAEVGVPASYLYMGVNLEASTVLLPTTRVLLWWKRRRGRRADMAGPGAHNGNGQRHRLRAVFRIVNLVLEEWYRAAHVAWHRRRGRIVICDRHFFADYFAHDIARRRTGTAAERIHGTILHRWYPRPDLLVVLDAPPRVMFERKGEGTLSFLEARRLEYLALGPHVPAFVAMDATGDTDTIVEAVVREIRRCLGAPTSTDDGGLSLASAP